MTDSAAGRGSPVRRWILPLALLASIAGTPRRASAAPPTTGFVDLYYTNLGGAGSGRVLKFYWPGGDPTTDNACNPPVTYTPARHFYRYVYGQDEITAMEIVGGPQTWLDEGFVPGTRYVYKLTEDTRHNCTICGQTQLVGALTTLKWGAQVEEVTAAHAQSVDSRLDLRYATNVFQDFPFGDSAYRGGLFTGFANDQSRVGRSYLRFNLPAAPAGALGRYVSTMSAWFTRMAATGSLDVQAHYCSDILWTESSLKWSTAPAFAAAATDTRTVSYNSQLGNAAAWVRWMVHDDVETVYGGTGGWLSEVLTSSSETTNAWGYFAKRQYESGHEPRVLVCFNMPAI